MVTAQFLHDSSDVHLCKIVQIGCTVVCVGCTSFKILEEWVMETRVICPFKDGQITPDSVTRPLFMEILWEPPIGHLLLCTNWQPSWMNLHKLAYNKSCKNWALTTFMHLSVNGIYFAYFIFYPWTFSPQIDTTHNLYIISDYFRFMAQNSVSVSSMHQAKIR